MIMFLKIFENKKSGVIGELKKEISKLNLLIEENNFKEKKYICSINDLNEQVQLLKNTNLELNKDNNFLKHENVKSLNEMKKVVKKLEEKEQQRKRIASSKGGISRKYNETVKVIEENKQLIRKKELDYLFALKVLFRKTRMTTDTKAFLSQRMKELEIKYSKDRK